MVVCVGAVVAGVATVAAPPDREIWCVGIVAEAGDGRSDPVAVASALITVVVATAGFAVCV